MVVTPHLIADINNISHGNGCHFVKFPPTSKWLISSTETYDKIMHDLFGNTYSEVYVPHNLESKLKDLHILLSDIYRRIPLEMGAIFFNGLQHDGYKGTMYSAILFSEVYAPQT